MVLKEQILTVSTLGWHGSLERTHFQQFLQWDGVVVSKELIFNIFYCGMVLKNLIFNSFYFIQIWWS